VKDAELQTSRAWAIKEALRSFWDSGYPKCAAKCFRAWYFWATHSRLKPMVEAAKTLTRQLANLMTYFTHRITNATAEGINSKIQMITLMACGYRNRDHYKTAIYFHCGDLDQYPRHEAG
jgi:transposase